MGFPVGGEEAKFWVVVMRMGRRGLLRRPWVRGPKHFGASETGACLWSSGGLKTLGMVDLGIWACRRPSGWWNMGEFCPQEMAGPLGGQRSARKRGQKMEMRSNHTGEGTWARGLCWALQDPGVDL